MGFPGSSDGKESTCNEGDLSLSLGLGRCLEEGNGYPCQCSCLENSRDRGASWAMVHVMAKSQIQLNTFHSPTQKLGLHKGLLHSSSALVLVIGVWVMLVWLRGWCVDSETVGPSYLCFSFQSLQDHMEIEQMSFGDVERSDCNTNIFRRNMGNVKNGQFSEHLLVIMFSSSKFPLVLSLIVSWTKHLYALLVSS